MADAPFIKEDDRIEGSPAWLITYGDMVTLLLVFFILLFSFSRIDNLRFKNAIKSIQGALGVINMSNSVMQKGETPMHKILDGAYKLDELNDFFKKFQVYVQDNNLSNVADLSCNEQGIVIAVTDMLLFKPGSAELEEHSRQALERVWPMVQMFPYEISIVGHADTTTIKTPRYPSNWELSLDRALSVKTFLTEHDSSLAKRIIVTAFAANRPLIMNGQEIKPELSRRVDIVLRKPEAK